MSRAFLRPAQKEISVIEDALIVHTLSERARLRLRAVLSWARGMSIKEAAAAISSRGKGVSRETVRCAVRLYRTDGLDPFIHSTGAPCGRRRIAPEKVAAIAAEMKDAAERGQTIAYREIQKRHGVSLGKVAAIARQHGFDRDHRRGAVAPAKE